MLPPRRMRACRRRKPVAKRVKRVIKPYKKRVTKKRKLSKKPRKKRVIRPRKRVKKVRTPRKKRVIRPHKKDIKNKKCPRGKEVSKKTGNCVKKCTRNQKRNPETGRCIKDKKVKVRNMETQTEDIMDTKHVKFSKSHHPGMPHRAHHHKTIHFDPRGLSAPAINSHAHSKSATYCKLTHRNMMELGHTFGVSFKLEKAIEERGKRSLCEVLSDFFPVECLKGWRITSFLGAGSFGYVFSIRNSHNKRGVLKIVRDEANFSVDKEIVVQKKFHELGLSPGVIDHCSYKPPRGGDRVHFILMERIDGVIDNFLMKKSHHKLLDTLVDRLFQIIKKMKDKNLTHGDFHSENIGFVYRRGDNPGTIQIIDHGMSIENGSNPELELVQFMRTIESRYSPKMNPDNRKFIKQKVHAMSKSMFNINLPKSLNGLENRFITLRRKLYQMRKE